MADDRRADYPAPPNHIKITVDTIRERARGKKLRDVLAACIKEYSDEPCTHEKPNLHGGAQLAIAEWDCGNPLIPRGDVDADGLLTIAMPSLPPKMGDEYKVVATTFNSDRPNVVSLMKIKRVAWSERPVAVPFKHTCKGSWLLGTACGECEKCADEAIDLMPSLVELEKAARSSLSLTMREHTAPIGPGIYWARPHAWPNQPEPSIRAVAVHSVPENPKVPVVWRPGAQGALDLVFATGWTWYGPIEDLVEDRA